MEFHPLICAYVCVQFKDKTFFLIGNCIWIKGLKMKLEQSKKKHCFAYVWTRAIQSKCLHHELNVCVFKIYENTKLHQIIEEILKSEKRVPMKIAFLRLIVIYQKKKKKKMCTKSNWEILRVKTCLFQYALCKPPFDRLMMERK